MVSRADTDAMVEWLFPNWSNPAAIAAVVAVRTLLNAALAGVVAASVGWRSRLTAAAAAVTLGSALVMVLVLRPGVLEHRASLVDLVAQLGLLALGGYAVSRDPTIGRAAAFAVVALVTLAVGMYTVPLYGEATVAP